MTRQEVYDKVKDALLKQNRHSKDRYGLDGKAGRCMYRGVGGLKCAIGHLIDDKYYNPTMEGCSIGEGHDSEDFPLVLEALSRSGISVEAQDLVFLERLQIIHDYIDPGTWQRALSELATTWSLTP